MRRRGVFSAALMALLVTSSASPAAAAPKPPRGFVEQNGGADSAVGVACLSLSIPPQRTETQVVASAAGQTGRRKVALTGRVFYVRALVGIVGDTCSGAPVTIEVIPPRGAEIAVSRKRPLWFDYVDTETPAAPSNGRDVLRSSPGRFGGRVYNVFLESEQEPIPLADDSGAFALYVPMVARRSMRGTSARRPRCRAKGSGEPPCSRRKARDHAQVAVNIGASVAPTLLVAEAGLFVRAPE